MTPETVLTFTTTPAGAPRCTCGMEGTFNPHGQFCDLWRTPERSDAYVLRFWLPILGPTATTLRWAMLDELTRTGRLAGALDAASRATLLGVSHLNVLATALHRAGRYGYLTPSDEHTWDIPAAVPRLPQKALRRRTAAFRAAHDTYLASLTR